jgi:hypothetical protein
VDLATKWHVSDVISLSDDRYKVFQLCDLQVTRPEYHNPRRTNSESHHKDLKANLWAVPGATLLVRHAELAVDMLQQAILSSYHQNCPARVVHSSMTVPWWNKELICLTASIRQLFNQAKRTGDWEKYEKALTCYNGD